VAEDRTLEGLGNLNRSSGIYGATRSQFDRQYRVSLIKPPPSEHRADLSRRRF
jgi:hypothetical protein